ncbi:hypothetical protein BDN67DRAFT_1015550 [Paxillus ammoniavirescens]|nr:hypothetical protein BDN67DRAFT_1015550 [Paxillus ammoniavirescens]
MNNLPLAISDEDDQELDQLISESIQNGPSRLQWDPDMEFTFINEFGPDSPRSNHAMATKPKKDHKRKDMPEPDILEERAPAKQAKLSQLKKTVRSKAVTFKDDDEEPKMLITAYLHLETTTMQLPHSCNKFATSVTKVVQCPPFMFHTNTPFNDFVKAIANTANTTSASLTLSTVMEV